jgi:hypothetical protein
VSTTTGRDLLERAERLAAELARCDRPVTTSLWESFDTTTYRMLREIIGPSRSDSGGSGRTRALLLQVIHSYPTPLRPPLDTVLSAAAAARFFPGSPTQFNLRLARGEFEATTSGNAHAIASRVLDHRADIAPADPTDPHPLARLSTTLGVLADLASRDRRQPQTAGDYPDSVAVDVAVRVLSFASVAARYTLRFGPVADGDRPLAVGQYAERLVDRLGPPQLAPPLSTLTARIGTGDLSLNERLDAAIHRWAEATDAELSRAIPATQAMANIAELGALMLATTHHLNNLRPDIAAAERDELTYRLRSGADALKAASTAWKTVTTLQTQSHAFGTASLELFRHLREAMKIGPPQVRQPNPAPDVIETLRVVKLGLEDVARYLARSQEVTAACLNTHLLFAPRRALAREQRSHGMAGRSSGHMAIDPRDGASVIAPIQSLPAALKELPLELACDRSPVLRSL